MIKVMNVKTARTAVAAALAAILSISATATQSFTLYDVVARNDKEAQRLADSPLTFMGCSIVVGANRFAVPRGQEWQIFTLNMPTQFAGFYSPEIPGPAHGVQDGGDYRTEYLNYDSLIAEYENLRAQYPEIVERKQIGTTIQNRPIYAYRIFNQEQLDQAVPPKSIIIGGTIHAREWISPATVLHITKMTVEGLASADNAYTNRLTDKVGIWVVPVQNPDGYIYTWTNNRLWRKNRRLVTGTTYGVDLNRNWAKGFGGQGSSGTPSSETYRGTAAFSEPETAAVRNLAQATQNIVGWIDFHSYGQHILYSWSYTTTPPVNQTYAHACGTSYQQAMLNAGGALYDVGQGSINLYIAAGTTKDWFYDQFNCASYTIELRNTSTFELPPAFITPTQDENWAGFQAWVNTLNL